MALAMVPTRGAQTARASLETEIDTSVVATELVSYVTRSKFKY